MKEPKAVEIKYEAERGCGFRKKGGLYLMSGKPGAPCGQLPLEMHVCAACNQGIKPAKGFTWIEPKQLFGIDNKVVCTYSHCKWCPVSHPPERAGLIWIGSMYYKTPEVFLKEAREMGISRRIPAVPNDFVAGETFIFLAHRQGIKKVCLCQSGEIADWAECPECDGTGEVLRPAIFCVFKPTHIEKVVGEDVTVEEVKELEKRGIVPVIVKPQQQELPIDGEECNTG